MKTKKFHTSTTFTNPLRAPSMRWSTRASCESLGLEGVRREGRGSSAVRWNACWRRRSTRLKPPQRNQGRYRWKGAWGKPALSNLQGEPKGSCVRSSPRRVRPYFAICPATSGSTGVPSCFTASSSVGLSPSAFSMVGAICRVVTVAATV
jgi:hypothetical protein